MKTTNLNDLAASKIAASAKKDLKKINPFYFVNELNKLAKKNEFVNSENLHKLQTRCKELHSGRYGFDACLFEKDCFGRFCTIKKVGKNEIPFNLLDANYGEILAINGKEMRFSNDGLFAIIYVPITLSLSGFITAFQKVVTDKENAEKAAQKAEKAAQKTAEKTAKNKEKEISKLVSRFVKGEISREELNAQILAIDLAA